MPLFIIAALTVLLLAALLLPPRLRRLQRARQFRRTVPLEWPTMLERRVPLYRRLPFPLRTQLHGHMQVFLAEKRFIGCNGLTVDATMRHCIAAQACMLLLNRDTDYFSDFTSILIYPESFVVPVVRRDGPLETHDQELRSGESWQRGPIVLSWADIAHGMATAGDGHNVVLHEFAHKLDEENGALDGVPALADDATQKAWMEILGREYDLLRLRAHNATDGVLDDYGATSPAEFFAVTTEAFFERAGRFVHVTRVYMKRCADIFKSTRLVGR